MNKTRFFLISGVLILSLVLVGIAMAADSQPQKENPPVNEHTDLNNTPNGSSSSQAPCALWPGPDGYGYMGQTTTYNWVDISASGSAVLLDDDSYAGPFPIGFGFNYYGTSYTDFYLSSNGFMSFDPLSISYLTNACPLPDSVPPYNIIAMMWDDLDPGDSADPIYYQTFASCPIGSGPCLVVQYEDFCHYPGGVGCTIAGTWETILYAATGNMLIQFEDAGGEQGSGSTTGIKDNNFDADYGLTYVCNTASSITDGLAVEFLFPPPLRLSPDAPTKEGCEKTDVTYTLTLANHTGTDATFDLSYASSWTISGPANLFVANMDSATFDVVIHIPCGGVSNGATVTASGNGYSDISTLTTFKTAGGPTEWESLAPINGEGRSRPAGAVVNGKVYVLGGEIPSGRADTVEEFDPATGLWTTKAGLMPTPASNICAAAIGTDIYIPGGFDSVGNFLATLQVYHTATDTWEIVNTDPLPAAKLGPGCASLGGKLYVFGGSTTGGVITNTAYVYDPAAAAGSRWTALPNMTYARQYLAGTAVNGKVYAVGGYDGTTPNIAYIEAFDPADSLWHTVTSMNTARGGPGTWFWGNTLVVCGGGWTTYLNSCESYDTTQGYSGVWANMTQTMLTGRRTFAYASLPDGLYAAAGYNVDYLTSAERLPVFTCVACTPPDIEVSPLSLHASQLPDTITSDQFQVCNVGETPLEWFLLESAPINNLLNPPTVTLPTEAIINSNQSDQAVPFEGVLIQVGAGLEGSAGSSGFGDPDAVLWDNGPLVTYPAVCAGMDDSRVQGSLGMSTYGFGHQFSVGNRIADDFTISAATSWNIQQVTFFAYQTNAPISPSPITGVYYQIWDGPPSDPGSSIVFGDLVTNRFISSTSPNLQRDWDGGMCPNYRYVYTNVASAGVTLPPGTYWIEWMTDGSLTYSGPWAPPITILGQTTTGNALQYSSSAWAPALDSGTSTPQGIPFIIAGTRVSTDIPWLSENPVAGVIPGGSCSNVDVSFNSNGLPVGVLSAGLENYSNDPVHPKVNVPVTLNVEYYHTFLPLTKR
jgi:hypothetical protein